jgi:hypothetical protein
MKKYILLLFTALSFAQASNQMVSFTQAQSLGFTLKSGQSHVTSNQCMTKTEAFSKYNLDASAMNSYASNQLVPRSAWVNGAPSVSFDNPHVISNQPAGQQISYPLTVTISGASATFRAFVTSSTGSPVNCTIAINGQQRTIQSSGVGTFYSTTIVMAPGVYGCTISYMQIDTQTASGGFSWTQ